ncbi:hypothetical protein [Flavobacterium sp. FlaQc-30]|uniref:hypothetical protein n=1 Tax=Flavobacterium sp. FlaQc-30 TaxID=3374179 RepID=UPI0037584492
MEPKRGFLRYGPKILIAGSLFKVPCLFNFFANQAFIMFLLKTAEHAMAVVECNDVISLYEKKLSVARNLLVTEKIDPEDYNLMKVEYNAIISKLEKEIGNVEDDRANIEQLTNSELENLLKLGKTFEDGTLADSREMIGLIFPENFTFEEKKIRTARINEMVNCIYLVNNRLRTKKNGTKDDIFLLSRVVTFSSQFTNHFMNDLKKLAYFQVNW